MAQESTFDDIISPFAQLRTLLGDTKPEKPIINMSIGGPKHPFPDWVKDKLYSYADGFGTYPASSGTDELRRTFQTWLERRFTPLKNNICGTANCLPLTGSREGLFNACFIAAQRKRALKESNTGSSKPYYVLMPNPFYQVYAAAAIACGATPLYLDATRKTGQFPDLDQITDDVWAQTIAFYVCSPANPQGKMASMAYLKRLVQKARDHDFMLFSDECYTDLYTGNAPRSSLEAGLTLSGDFKNILSFFSLSKRSSLPGLRSGFCAGDAAFMADFARFRNVAAPQMPTPIQQVSIDLWKDESHVETNRAFYKEKFNLTARQLDQRIPYEHPDGAMFLWLDMSHFGGGEAAAKQLWQKFGLRGLPGAYLAKTGVNNVNPGSDFLRLALVDDLETTMEALERLKEFSGSY